MAHSASLHTQPGSAESSSRTYAIGDVHGRLDLLTRAFEEIDAAERGGTAKVVMLGDYVDRGPDSCGVVAFLMSYSGPHRLVCLKGNHEDLMVGAARGDASSLNCWMGNGGFQTLSSYGEAVDQAHIDWLEALPVLHTDRHRIYVHAGLMPGFEPEQQEDEWCLWIRDRFLDAGDLWDKHVVHGHTHTHRGKPDRSRPEMLSHRTNLDTCAYYTGILSVGVFDDDTRGGAATVWSITTTAVEGPSVGTSNASETKPLPTNGDSQ